jgi:hypothetical protein
MVTVWADNYPLENIVDLQEELEKLFEKYPDKRITVQIRDQPVIRPGQRPVG